MEEKNSWKVFETTGSVIDYLNYKQVSADRVKRNETDERYESRRYECAGNDSSEYASGGL